MRGRCPVKRLDTLLIASFNKKLFTSPNLNGIQEWNGLFYVFCSRKANVSSEKNDEVKGGRESSRQAGENRNLMASRLAHARTIAVVVGH